MLIFRVCLIPVVSLFHGIQEISCTPTDKKILVFLTHLLESYPEYQQYQKDRKSMFKFYIKYSAKQFTPHFSAYCCCSCWNFPVAYIFSNCISKHNWNCKSEIASLACLYNQNLFEKLICSELIF
jgi:hypothetical protein